MGRSVECKVLPELDVENFEEELYGEEVNDEDARTAQVDTADGNGKEKGLEETLTVEGNGKALSLHGRGWRGCSQQGHCVANESGQTKGRKA